MDVSKAYPKKKLVLQDIADIRYIPVETSDEFLCFNDKDSIQVYAFSRKDGRITHEIPIPFEKKIEPFVSREATSGPTMSRTFFSSIQKDKNGFLIQTISSDIAYRLTPTLELIPVMERTPNLKDMQTPVIMEYGPDSERYAFFSTVKMTFDWENMTGFPRSFLYLDKSTGEIFEQEIVNTDFEGQPGILPSNFFGTCNAAPGIGAVWFFTHMLKHAHDEGKLNGKLKEIVDGMDDDDDDNGIVMLATFK